MLLPVQPGEAIIVQLEGPILAGQEGETVLDRLVLELLGVGDEVIPHQGRLLEQVGNHGFRLDWDGWLDLVWGITVGDELLVDVLKVVVGDGV